VNRLLTVLEIDATEALPKGAKILANGKEAGEITSSAVSPATGRAIAFGTLRADALTPGKTLSVAEAAITATRPPMNPAAQ
jgi:glycine cleavage system aminomethyltransferase T